MRTHLDFQNSKNEYGNRTFTLSDDIIMQKVEMQTVMDSKY